MLIGLIVVVSSCCISYGLKGSNLNKEIKTLSVAYIENKASIVAPQLSPIITEKLKNKFTRESSLKLANANADLQFSGTITTYSINSSTQQQSQTATNRLSIGVQVKCINQKDSAQSFIETFTRFADFPGTQQLNAVEQNLINEIADLLVQDIFNKAVINW